MRLALFCTVMALLSLFVSHDSRVAFDFFLVAALALAWRFRRPLKTYLTELLNREDRWS
jgi:hypothetical protein